mgnify:CR=1 FL=1
MMELFFMVFVFLLVLPVLKFLVKILFLLSLLIAGSLYLFSVPDIYNFIVSITSTRSY